MTAFSWDYDRNPLDSHPHFMTFSVGVFQWRPKASGKGVKKSKSIRVKGYVDEPEAVYEFARELCAKLNNAKVDAENPPDWVQKQYSVPMPKGLVIERISDDLTGSQVRSAQLQVMRRELLPAGFVKGKGGTYVRRRGDQIHLIDFQSATRGHEYTVNLGFHYTFVPPFFQKKNIKTDHYHLLDCAIRSRVGDFIGDGRDKWFEYGSDREALKSTLRDNAAACLQIFDKYEKKWEEPAWWLDTRKKGKISHRRIRPWSTEADHYLNLFVACVAIHVGENKLAQTLLSELIEDDELDFEKRFYRQLLKKAHQ